MKEHVLTHSLLDAINYQKEEKQTSILPRNSAIIRLRQARPAASLSRTISNVSISDRRIISRFSGFY